MVWREQMVRAQFDREQVIADSTRLFWQQGFGGSSMQQVCRATGLNPGSLYLAFGSKEGLYEEALAHYAERACATVRQALDAAPSVGEGICRLLLKMVDESGRPGYCSCFMIKSQLELSASESDLLPLVTRHLEQMEALYADYLLREHPPARAAEYASSLVLQIFGLRVYGYLGRPREVVLAALKLGLSWLPWDPL